MSETVLAGDNDVDIESFHFMYDNVIMRRKDRDAKATCLLTHQEGDASFDYRLLFTNIRALSEKDQNNAFMRNFLGKRYDKAVNRSKLISMAIKAQWYNEMLINSLLGLNVLSNKAEFNNMARIGMMPNAAMRHT